LPLGICITYVSQSPERYPLLDHWNYLPRLRVVYLNVGIISMGPSTYIGFLTRIRRYLVLTTHGDANSTTKPVLSSSSEYVSYEKLYRCSHENQCYCNVYLRSKAVLRFSLSYPVALQLSILIVAVSLDILLIVAISLDIWCGLLSQGVHGQFPFDKPNDPNETEHYECTTD